MNKKIINGKELSILLNSSLKNSINDLLAQNKRNPKLVIIQIGDNKASNIYIRNKLKSCSDVGIISEHLKFDSTISEVELINEIIKLNHDKTTDGIIVQLPLPDHIDDKKVNGAISINKDADGFSPHILGNLMINNTNISPATPMGILKLLEWKKINLSGKDVVIIGRSNIVGKPLANMLINESCTVTICNTKTKNIFEKTKTADILIVAAGVAKLIKKEHIKDGVIIIDVGTNKLDGKYCGDVDFDDVIDKVSLITPVPGGVGPMTISCLLQNTYNLYLNNEKSK